MVYAGRTAAICCDYINMHPGSVATKPPLASTILFPLCFLHVVMTCCQGLLGFICVLRCPFKALLRFKDMTTLGVSLTENSSYLQALSIRAEGVSRIFVLHLFLLNFCCLERGAGQGRGATTFCQFFVFSSDRSSYSDSGLLYNVRSRPLFEISSISANIFSFSF